MEIAPVCIDCVFYETAAKCKAFKDIPALIWDQGNPHKKPLADQENNIVFEAIK